MRLNTVKRNVMAAALAVATAVAVAGGPSNAFALGFNFGDLGFFVYGGDNERYESLGTGSAVPTLEGISETTRNISSDLATLNAGAATGLRYSLGGTSTDSQFYYVSTTSATLSPTQIGNSTPLNAAGDFLFWSGQHATATGGTGNPLANNPAITSRAAAHSYTGFLGTSGTVNGQLGFITHGSLDQLLNIFKVNIDGNPETYVKVATALLSASGQLTITPAAIPIPAAVFLFGSGLIGLVGIARRSFNRPA